MIFDCEALTCVHNDGDGDCYLASTGINITKDAYCDSFEES